jgi:hypothetical protein
MDADSFGGKFFLFNPMLYEGHWHWILTANSLIIGGIASLMQIWLLKGRLPGAWFLLSVWGYILVSVILSLGDYESDARGMIWCFALAGLMLGAFQAMAIFRRYRKAGLLVVASTLGWGLGAVVPVYVLGYVERAFAYDIGGAQHLWGGAVLYVVFIPMWVIMLGFFPAFISGFTLRYILNQHRPLPQAEITEHGSEFVDTSRVKVRIVSEKFTAITEKLLSSVKMRKSSWILLTTLGAAIAVGASTVAMKKIDSMGALTWSVVLFGFVLGSMQWLVLRESIELRWWLLATALGSAPALAIVFNVQSVIGTAFKNEEFDWFFLVIFAIVVGLIFAVGMAVAQWLVLRERIKTTKRWLGVNLRGWWLGMVVGSLAAVALYNLAVGYAELLTVITEINPIAIVAWPAAIGGAVAGAIAGAISWRALHDLTAEGEVIEADIANAT